MVKNICKNRECKLYDPDYPNNCRVIREVKACRILYPLTAKEASAWLKKRGK